MKPSWYSIVAVIGVIGILTLFVLLQYNWLERIADADRERMKRRVETDTARFAEEFNREIQSAYFNFQTQADSWKLRDWTEFNGRYDYWKGNASYPELVRSFTFVSKDLEAQPMRYNAEKRAFEASEMTEELNELRVRFIDDKTFKPVYDDRMALVMPIHEGKMSAERMTLRSLHAEKPILKMPEKFGYLVIMLDPAVINERLLPALVQKYFPEGDLNVSIANKAGDAIFQTAAIIGDGDASAPLLSLAPDNFMFFSNRELLSKIEGEKGKSVVLNQRVESHTLTRTEANGPTSGTFKIELQRGEKGEPGKPRTSMMTGTMIGNEPWKLSVQHTAGSVNAFVTGERNKSFLVGLGIYLLLVGGIIAIVLSALRAKRFAQRQIDFVSSVSHEFRTPIAVIYSAGENLADGVAKDGAQISRYGDLIKGEGKKLSGMVERILEFAGANSGRKKYNFESANIAEITRNALAACGSVLDENDFAVETNVADDLVPITADAEALSSAIQNLILNAVKYSNGSRWLRVSAANGNGRINIAVEDKGIGIPKNERRKVFEPFYRSKEVVDAQIHGNGLGLSLVKEIAEAHGGKVIVESEPGKGSRFTIELPQA